MCRIVLIVILAIVINNGYCQEVPQRDTLVDTTKRDVPESILELVKQYDKQVKEANAKRQQLQIIDPPASEIDGVIMDETLSKSGRDFYELFFANFIKPQGYKNYYIKIKERPFRMSTTLIEVYLKEQLMYQQILKRRFDEVEEMAKESVEVIQYQMYYELQSQRALQQQYQN
jgi:curli production assembly/transport component CsgE